MAAIATADTPVEDLTLDQLTAEIVYWRKKDRLGESAQEMRNLKAAVEKLAYQSHETARIWMEQLADRMERLAGWMEVAEAAHNDLTGRVEALEGRTWLSPTPTPPGTKVWAVVRYAKRPGQYGYAKSPGQYGVFFTQEAAAKRADELLDRDEGGHVYTWVEWEVQS